METLNSAHSKLAKSRTYSFAQDTTGHIKRLAEFVGVALTDEQVQQIAVDTSFKNMSENKMWNKDFLTTRDPKTGEVTFKFMRKGN